MVLRGLVIAAEPGARNGACDVAVSASLAPVANKPILLHALETLERAGVGELSILASSAQRVPLAQVLAERPASGRPVSFVEGGRMRADLRDGDAVVVIGA